MNNVLVTGGAGFIGSHVVPRLLRRDSGFEVTVLDALTYAVTATTCRTSSARRGCGSLGSRISGSASSMHVSAKESVEGKGRSAGGSRWMAQR